MARLPGNEGLQIFGNGTHTRNGAGSAVDGILPGESALAFAVRAKHEANSAWNAASAAVNTAGYPTLLTEAMGKQVTAGRAVRRLPVHQLGLAR